MTNSIAKGYNSIAELPTEVRSSFDETDQEKWMNEYNSALGDKTDESSIKQAREDAWMKMQDCPSGLSVETWGSVEVKDWDNEVVNIQSLADHCDAFIDHGGRINDVHTNLPLGSCWKWERAVHPETGQDAIKFWFNIYRDTETTERAREEILEGIKNSVSIGAEAPRGEYKCDEKGCYVERNVTDYYELSICEAPANPEANFIAINGENIAKSRHHNKGDMVFKLKDMTVHEDYTTCPIQNIKRNLIKSGIKDTHIGKDNHITTKGITRSQLLKVLKESDATCKYRETSPGVYEIKVSKSVKKRFNPEDTDRMKQILDGIYASKLSDFGSYDIDSYNEDAHELLINIDGDISSKVIHDILQSKYDIYSRHDYSTLSIYDEITGKSVKKSDEAMYEQLDEMINAISSAIEDIGIYIRDGDFSTASGYANTLVRTAQELEEALCNVAGKSVSKSIEGYEYSAMREISELLEHNLGSDAYRSIDGYMDAPTTESFAMALNKAMDEYQAQFTRNVKKDVDPNADIQQYIDEAIKNGWAYKSNDCVYLQKEVSEAFFKDMFDKGYLQCVSGYWGFRNEIIAKLTKDEQDIYEAIKSKYTQKSHAKIKARVIKSGYTEQEFDNVVSYITKEGSAGASGGSGSMGTSSAGACNTVYGEKPKEETYTNDTPKKKPKSRKKGNRK